MTLDAQLENYLTRLDRALGGVSVSDRSDIVTEIKSHVLSTRERHPERRIADILEALGEPEAVANRFLLERGLKPGKPARGPMAKWLVIGFLGTLGMFLVFITFMVVRFTPLVSVDEKSGRVKILGGLIDVSENEHALGKGFLKNLEGGEGRRKEGKLKLPATVKEIKVRFTNGKFDFTRAEGNELTWWCEIYGPADVTVPQLVDDKAAFELDKQAAAKCDIGVPAGLMIDVSGSNAKISLLETESPARINLANAKVLVKNRAGVAYRYETSVTNGLAEELESSQNPKALPVIIKVANGRISKD